MASTGTLTGTPVSNGSKVGTLDDRETAPPGRANTLIAIGSSTGGVKALQEIIPRLPEDMPPIVIAQHMPSGFTSQFAGRLDNSASLRVREASNRHPVRWGEVLVAPGNRHLSITEQAGQYLTNVSKGSSVNNQRPSCDVLFESVAETFGADSIGVILTGMGRDGAAGLKQMRDTGAYTIAQDRKSSTVYGMPKEAKNYGAVEKETSIGRIPQELVNRIRVSS
jgi:two-component system chemotaxis response regulator CheB